MHAVLRATLFVVALPCLAAGCGSEADAPPARLSDFAGQWETNWQNEWHQKKRVRPDEPTAVGTFSHVSLVISEEGLVNAEYGLNVPNQGPAGMSVIGQRIRQEQGRFTLQMAGAEWDMSLADDGTTLQLKNTQGRGLLTLRRRP